MRREGTKGRSEGKVREGEKYVRGECEKGKIREEG